MSDIDTYRQTNLQVQIIFTYILKSMITCVSHGVFHHVTMLQYDLVILILRQFRIKQKLSFRCCHRPIWLICGWGVRWRPQNCQFLVNTGPYRPPNLPYPYGRSIFKIHFFAILIADSDLSQKSVYTNYSPFLKIRAGTESKMQKTSQKEGKFNMAYH